MIPISSLLFLGTLYLLLLISEVHTADAYYGSSTVARSNNTVAHRNFVTLGPFPILEIGYKHIISQIGSNATVASNYSLPKNLREHFGASKVSTLLQRDAPAQCGPGQPCADNSCCNSEGKCGYTPYNCVSSPGVQCISNCNAKAMCGVNSLNSAQHCPLQLCCSAFGFCGTSNLYCANSLASQVDSACQKDYGSCQVVQPPSCNPGDGSASRGRKVGYYQSVNLGRRCNRIGPNDLDTTGYTHMIFTFASIDPNSCHVVPLEPSHPALYTQFTARKSPGLQTWIAIGGYSFSDPGPTQRIWSDMVSGQGSRAAFINSLITFMIQYGFQGVDLDWEFPGVASRGGHPGDTSNFVSLVQEMRSAFGSRYGISIALPPDFSSLQYFNPAALAPYIDFFNFMSYDLHGPWEAYLLGANVRSQTSIIDIASDLLPLWFDNVSPSKLNLGVAYYGRGYTLQNPGCTDIGCQYTGASNAGPCTESAGTLSLREIQVLIQQQRLVPEMLGDQMIKQISWGNQWVGYDDSETINLKTNWADKHCLGGMVFWSMDLVNAGTGDSPILPSTDSTCSSTRTCISSPVGPCCSAHGFCGSDAGHCSINNGCQITLGTCNMLSIDGSCGLGKSCLGSGLGDCCSALGWCGNGGNYCGAGCQGMFGSCG